ncbi:MAG TPA: hypothetical protein VFX16_36675 [Pseudonocardiaceae bacterium]|nr:hypothetical protein [Pseudonocardiaceae bacterium]
MNDPVLLSGLAAEFERHDPVPAAVQHAAELAGSLVQQAKSWNSLALLTGAGVRGDAGLVRLAGVDLEIDPAPDGTVRLTGLAAGGEVWVRWPGGERCAGAGQFAVDGLPAGPLSIVVRTPGRPDAVGPWFVG